MKTHDVTKYLTKPQTWTGPLEWEDMDWIALAHGGDKQRARVNAITNVWVSQNTGNFLTI